MIKAEDNLNLSIPTNQPPQNPTQPNMRLHIAILDVDIPIPHVYSSRGLYSTQFRTLLRSAATRLNQTQNQTPSSTRNAPATDPIEIQTTAYDAVGGCLPPFESLRTTEPNSPAFNSTPSPIDGILITGSAASAYDTANHPWIKGVQDFLARVYNEFPSVRIFGSCFGHQIIAQTLLVPDVRVEACPAGYEVGIHPITLDETFRASFPGLPSGDSGFRLQLIHGDWVVGTQKNQGDAYLPTGWINVGRTELCPVQGLYKPGRVLSLQGHFEFDTFVNEETCREFGRRGGWKDDDVERFVRQIRKSAGEAGGEDEDDSKVAAEVVVRFFGGGMNSLGDC